MVLVKRWKTMAVVTALIFALGVFIALSKPKTNTTLVYSNTIEIGSQVINGYIRPFEPPQALLAKLQYSFIQQVLSDNKSANPENNNTYTITPSIPDNSNLIVLTINATEDQSDISIKLLQDITQKVIQEYTPVYESRKQQFLSSIKQYENKIASLNSEKNRHSEEIQLLKDIGNYKMQLANLRNTREISPPVQSTKTTKSKRNSIIVVAAFAGIFLGVFAAFFTEFLSKVKHS
jgi:hypothetical protein